MPRQTEQPTILSQINHYMIEALHIYLEPTPHAVIEVARSFADGDDITLIDVLTHQVAGQAFVTEMTAATTGGSMYDEIKARLYVRCIADGVIPADATEA